MENEATATLVVTSLSEAVRDRLMRLIAQGALQPGDRLNEVQLADRFGVSRGPVREAARDLEGKGVLVSRPRHGFYVAAFTWAEITDIYEAKRWLEAAFIADLAAHSAIATRRALLAAIDEIDPSDRIAFSETLFAFRETVCRHIRNHFLAELMIALYRKFYVIGAVVNVAESEGRLDWIVTTLRRFWTAMIAGDFDGARAVMEADTAHWLADLRPRFTPEPTPETSR